MALRPKQPRPYGVFISYSSKDRWIARQIANQIEQRGKRYDLNTFLDENNIEGGQSIRGSIRREIRQCSEFLVLLSRYSVDRPWVLVEIGAAFGLGKRIIPIVDKVTPEEMPDVIRDYKAIDLNNFDEYIEQLCRRAGKRR